MLRVNKIFIGHFPFSNSHFPFLQNRATPKIKVTRFQMENGK